MTAIDKNHSPDLAAIFKAGRTRRWHVHPVLSDYDDRLDAHQGRVARLAMALFPGDHALVCAALRHDDGESATADLPSWLKDNMPPEVRAWFDTLENLAECELWGPGIPCDPLRLMLCDRLDSIQWAAHNAPRLMAGKDWKGRVIVVRGMAKLAGVAAAVDSALSKAGAR